MKRCQNLTFSLSSLILLICLWCGSLRLVSLSSSCCPASVSSWSCSCSWLELQTKVREDFTITEKASTRAFSWLEAPTNAFTFNTLLRHYAEWVPKNSAKVITDECLNSVLNVCEGTSSLYRDCEIFTNIHLMHYPLHW